MSKLSTVKCNGQKIVSKKSKGNKALLFNEICFGSLMELSRNVFSNLKITYSSSHKVKKANNCSKGDVMIRILITMFLLQYSQFSLASLGKCPEGTSRSDDTVVNMIEFLKNNEGIFKLGSCQVELQVCDIANGEESTDNGLAAEILVTEKDGFQRYIPFYINQFKNDSAKRTYFSMKKSYVYLFADKNYDPETGKSEKLSFEIAKKSQSNEINFLEIGFSSDVERNNNTNKKWITCGTEREEYVRTHPLSHAFKSVWWWLAHSK